MDLKNKYLIMLIRTLFAVFMLYAGISGFISMITVGINSANILQVSGLIALVKVIEVIAGFMLLFNFRAALATAMFAPLTVGFLVFNIMTNSENAFKVLLCVLLVIINIYFVYIYWNKFQPLFEK